MIKIFCQSLMVGIQSTNPNSSIQQSFVHSVYCFTTKRRGFGKLVRDSTIFFSLYCNSLSRCDMVSPKQPRDSVAFGLQPISKLCIVATVGATVWDANNPGVAPSFGTLQGSHPHHLAITVCHHFRRIWFLCIVTLDGFSLTRHLSPSMLVTLRSPSFVIDSLQLGKGL